MLFVSVKVRLSIEISAAFKAHFDIDKDRPEARHFTKIWFAPLIIKIIKSNVKIMTKASISLNCSSPVHWSGSKETSIVVSLF